MYEMEGASPGLAARSLLASPRAAAGAVHPRRSPVSRLPRVPGGSRVVPVSSGECISTAFARDTQESALTHFEFSCPPHDIHSGQAVVRTQRRLSTGLCTVLPQATRCSSKNTCIAVAVRSQATFKRQASQAGFRESRFPDAARPNVINNLIAIACRKFPAGPPSASPPAPPSAAHREGLKPVTVTVAGPGLGRRRQGPVPGSGRRAARAPSSHTGENPR